MPSQQAKDLGSTSSIWPNGWELGSNLKKALSPKGTGLWPWEKGWDTGYVYSFLITFINVLVSIALKIFVTMLLGYAFSLKKWYGKEFIWFILMALLVLPEVALLAGQSSVVESMKKSFAITSKAKTSQYAFYVFVIAIPFVASVFNALMFRNAFEAIPGRIKEVAMIDGVVGWKYLFKIAIPMVSPTTLTVIILTTLASWNSYLWPSLVATGYPVMSVWLFNTGIEQIEGGNDIVLKNIKMAGAVLVILPMFIFYFLFRTKIMNSISRQGSTIKG